MFKIYKLSALIERKIIVSMISPLSQSNMAIRHLDQRTIPQNFHIHSCFLSIPEGCSGVALHYSPLITFLKP